MIKNTIKCAIFASGHGSNFEKLVHYSSRNPKCRYKVVLLVSDRRTSRAVEKAKVLGIDRYCFTTSRQYSKKNYEIQILETLKMYDIQIIALAGFMRILSPYFIKTFSKEILNIHPSLLPKFRGLNAIERNYQAIIDGVSNSAGVSIHYVDEGIDTGKLLTQQTLELLNITTLEQFKIEIHKLEHQLYPATLDGLCTKILKSFNS